MKNSLPTEQIFLLLSCSSQKKKQIRLDTTTMYVRQKLEEKFDDNWQKICLHNRFLVRTNSLNSYNLYQN